MENTQDAASMLVKKCRIAAQRSERRHGVDAHAPERGRAGGGDRLWRRRRRRLHRHAARLAPCAGTGQQAGPLRHAAQGDT
eukprot:6213198-Pleurochrysis_carterae.AAC.3